MQCITLATSKGGNGKTTLAVNIATGLALRGHRVLVVDLDQQGQATFWLSGEESRARKGAAEALFVKSLEDSFLTWAELAPETYGFEGDPKKIAILAGNPKLEHTQQFLSSIEGPERLLVLADLLAERADDFDYVVIDTPPSRDARTGNALCAADWIVIPVSPDVFGLRGREDLMSAYRGLEREFEVMPPVLGEVLFGVNKSEQKMLRHVEEVAKEGFTHLFESHVRVSSAAKPLPDLHVSSFAHDTRGSGRGPLLDPKGAEDYKLILEELMARIEKLTTANTNMEGAA